MIIEYREKMNNVNGDQETVNKVFVGNVPFQCTKEEFIDCFKDQSGFIDADIIRRYRSKLSRGFGFVIFKSQEQANTLIGRTDIVLKDRVLRFSTYSDDNTRERKKTYQIFIFSI